MKDNEARIVYLFTLRSISWGGCREFGLVARDIAREFMYTTRFNHDSQKVQNYLTGDPPHTPAGQGKFPLNVNRAQSLDAALGVVKDACK